MRRVRVLSSALAVVALVGLAGCGGGDDKEEATTDATTTVPVATTRAPRTFTGANSEEFCVLARANINTLREVPTVVSSPEDLQALLQEVAPQVREAVAVAPAEIKDTATVLAEGFERLLTGDYTVLSEPEFGVAGQDLQEYGRQVCGITG